MSKDVRIRVSADTNQARKEIEDLQRRIKDASKVKAGPKETVGKVETVETMESDFSDSVEKLGTDVKSLIRAIDRLSRTTERSEKTGSSAPSSPSSSKKDSSPDAGQIASKIGAAIGAGKYLHNYASQGAAKAQSLDSQAMRTYGRLGDYGSNFSTPRRELGRIGRKYGNDYTESFATQQSLLRGGFKGNDELKQDTEAAMRTSLAYGIDSSVLAEGFNAQVKRGAFGQGNMSQYLNLQAAGVEKNGMKGREEEQFRSLNQIADTITSGKLEVSSEDFKDAANLQATLAMLNPALKGDKGAEVVGQMQSLANPNDEQTIRMVGYGGELGYGPEGLKKARERAENITSRESLEAIGRNAKAYGMDETMLSLFLAQKGLKQETANIVSKSLLNGDFESAQNAVSEKEGENATTTNVNKIQASRGFTQERYNAEKENAQAEAGNVLNAATSPLKNFYNFMPAPIQSGLSVGLGMGTYSLGGRLVGKAAGKVLGGLKGGTVATGTGKVAEGVAEGSKVAGATTSTAKTVGKAAETIGETAKTAETVGSATKATKFLGKNSKLIGRAGIGLAAATYGVKAISEAKEGDGQAAAGTVGEGIGSIGGGLAGAKLGGALGTAVAPGLGTAAGAILGGVGGLALGLVGGKVGKSVGEGAYGLFSSGDKSKDGKIKNEADLLTRKEKILKKEEVLVDKMLGGLYGEDLRAPDGSVRRLETTDGRGNSKSDYANQRDQFAQQYADGTVGGEGGADTVGGGGGSYGPLKGNNRHEKAFNFFTSRGYSKEAAAGIIGNLMQESGTDLNPSLHQKGGPGRGLAQWTVGSDRWRALQRYAKSKGTKWDDFQTQLEFIDMEMNNKNLNPFWRKQNSSLQAFKNQKSVDNATYLFDRVYERSGRPMMKNRKKYANQVYNQYARKSYAVGVDRVSEDQLAYLHKDETVLNRFDAKQYRERQENTNNTNVQTLNINLTANENVDEKLLEIIKRYIGQMAQNGQSNGFKLNHTFRRSPV